MTLQKHFFIAILSTVLLSSFNGFAQKDSIVLESVTITGLTAEHFMSGLKIQQFDSTSLDLFRFKKIDELLALYTPMAFKNYGPGQLNTVSFRGTSANHTAVLWNGLNINSPTLGQTDFSTVPVAGFDLLSVQYGSASSVVGSDAVGGSILLGSSMPTDGFRFFAGRQQESFNNSQTQLGATYVIPASKGRLSGKTHAYYGEMLNAYPYTQRKNVSLLPTETFQKGVVQDFFFKPSAHQELSAHAWLTSNRLTLTPENLAGRELTLTEAYRTMLRYSFKNLSVRGAWVRDILDYARGDYANLDHAATDKLSFRGEYDFEWSPKKFEIRIATKAGAEIAHFKTKVAGYERSEITENRADLFLLNRIAYRALTATLNLRQAFVTGFNPPFTPSVGADYKVISTGKFFLNLRGSLARSYRVPTLNERYWKDLGNPDIRPESGWNKEAGLDLKWDVTETRQLGISATAFHNRIKDWTYWNPSRNYRVENLQQVLARGIEAEASWNKRGNDWEYGATISYAWTNSVQEKAYDAYSVDIVGKQLVFVPIHNVNGRAHLKYKQARFTAQWNAISRRYSTADHTQSLNGYGLLNVIAETSISYLKMNMQLQAHVNNITNTFYLNVRNNAMPGRSYAINLILSFHTKQKARF